MLNEPTQDEIAATISKYRFVSIHDRSMQRSCPGYGDDCGLPLAPGMDLCGDCHTGRLNAT